MQITPAGWTAADETEYQAYLVKLKAEIDAGGSSDEMGMLHAIYLMLDNPVSGRAAYLKARANGWIK